MEYQHEYFFKKEQLSLPSFLKKFHLQIRGNNLKLDYKTFKSATLNWHTHTLSCFHQCLCVLGQAKEMIVSCTYFYIPEGSQGKNFISDEFGIFYYYMTLDTLIFELRFLGEPKATKSVQIIHGTSIFYSRRKKRFEQVVGDKN